MSASPSPTAAPPTAPPAAPAASAPQPRDRRNRTADALIFLGVVLIGFGLRATYVLQLQANPFYSIHEMDPLYHHQWAQAVAAGDEDSFLKNEPYFRAPLYSWLLGLLYRVFGSEDSTIPRLFQAGLGAFSCGLLFLIGRIAFSRLIGALAGLALASYWLIIYYEAELLISVLASFLSLLLLLLLLIVRERRWPWMWLLCGLVLGVCALARTEILLFAPLIVLWLVALHWPAWRRALGYGLLAALGAIAAILPVTIRNALVGGDAVLVASSGGVNFYIGNNPHSDGMSAVIAGDPVEWWPCYRAQIERAERAVGRTLKPSEVSRWYFDQARQFLLHQPESALPLLFKKLRTFWSYWEVSNNQDIYFTTSQFTPLIGRLPLNFATVAPLGVLGALASLRRDRRLWILHAFLLVSVGTVVAFFVTARYRIPAVLMLILFAAFAIRWFGEQLRDRRWTALGAAAIVLMFMGNVAAQRPPGVDAEMVQGHRSVGLLLASQRKFAEAEPYLAQAVARAERSGFPLDAMTHYTLAFIRAQRGEWDTAADGFRRTLQLDPQYPGARANLEVALRSRQPVDSRGTAEPPEALVPQIEREPRRADLRWSYARALLRRGDAERAAEQFGLALELDAGLVEPLGRIAQRMIQERREADALRVLQAATRSCASAWPLHAQRIQLLATAADLSIRDVARAIRDGEQLCAASQNREPTVLLATAVACLAGQQPQRALALARSAAALAEQRGETELAAQAQRIIQRLGGSEPPP